MTQTSSTISITTDGNSSIRLQRNLAEKHRREKLNGYIGELTNIVPMVSMATRRLNKTSILRLSAAHLRMYQSLGSKSSKLASRWQEGLLSEAHLKELIEAVDGFVLVTTSTGKIIYVSHSVERFLGHQHIEMIGHTLLSFVHPDDDDYVRQQFQDLPVRMVLRNGKLTCLSKISFHCRLREHNQPRSEILTYQLAEIKGHIEGENDLDSTGSNSQILFKAFVRIIHSSPLSEVSLPEALQDVYITRHKLDGTIIYTDHRISTITGHLPQEVLGYSAYKYIMPEDIPVALFKHNLMFANSGEQAVVVYRLLSRNQVWVYLKSFGHLKYDNSTDQVDHFVCVNHVLNEEDGKRELQEFTQRYMPCISGKIKPLLFQSIQAAQSGDYPHLQKIQEALSALQTIKSCDFVTDENNTTSFLKSELPNCDEAQNFPALHAALTSPTYPVPPSNLTENTPNTTFSKQIFHESSVKAHILEWNSIDTKNDTLMHRTSPSETLSSKLNNSQHSPLSFPTWTTPPMSYLQTNRCSDISTQSEESDYEKYSPLDGDLSFYPTDVPEVEYPFDDRRSSMASVYSSASEPETYHTSSITSPVVFDSQANESVLVQSQDSTLVTSLPSANATVESRTKGLLGNMTGFPLVENVDIETLSSLGSKQSLSYLESVTSLPSEEPPNHDEG
ncbi:aryl hydrocarbon receptor nuclear translocator-like isoform X1 [Limulus polyphemus]|uniref:Aryl hydrocarbon receptor nuclear translocator-like isoform X1 n=2 Tax=Limulus polyphemus TaxID=6850 RepID=A0ABM1SQ45_LIMPO|nr:aryl hydrocarbon receptor nuclear translocator-like isoform X1 [Limulus polyphemus]XP_022245751.1 aryl hydrocarbon receptor nuclear translocator-like isoform X1 [Limulus polyphemus]